MCFVICLKCALFRLASSSWKHANHHNMTLNKLLISCPKSYENINIHLLVVIRDAWMFSCSLRILFLVGSRRQGSTLDYVYVGLVGCMCLCSSLMGMGITLFIYDGGLVGHMSSMGWDSVNLFGGEYVTTQKCKSDVEDYQLHFTPKHYPIGLPTSGSY